MAFTITPTSSIEFAPMRARRVLISGGIALIATGMLFGDIFAVFVLHQNGSRTGETLLAATRAVAARDVAGVKESFARIGGLLEDHGTKLDAHAHMIAAGYLALLLALLQPYVALSSRSRNLLAELFVAGGVLLPVGIFLIHYVGLAYSPFPLIGWASILADSAGGLLIVGVAGEAWGLLGYLWGRRTDDAEPELRHDNSWENRTLLTGGTILILTGFLYGAWYAGFDLYEHEAREKVILSAMLNAATGSDDAVQSVNSYGSLQAEKALDIAAHSHVIEFGLLAILLSFVQPWVFLSSRWKRFWVKLLLAGSIILPVFVLLEMHLGLIAGGIADIGGLMVLMALTGMLAGIFRHTGALDAQQRRVMSGGRKLLIVGGLSLASFGMLYGLYYALLIEHQTLDRMGGSLAAAFVDAAERNLPAAQSAIDAYTATKYDYVRQVDAHSHWIGLAMLMIIFGVLLERMAFTERTRSCIAVALALGSFSFPGAVILQTFIHGSSMASALALAGSALVVGAMAAAAVGFARQHG
jgi:hypothetical protein